MLCVRAISIAYLVLCRKTQLHRAQLAPFCQETQGNGNDRPQHAPRFLVVALLSVCVFPFPTRFLGFSLEEGAPHKKRNTDEGLRQLSRAWKREKARVVKAAKRGIQLGEISPSEASSAFTSTFFGFFYGTLYRIRSGKVIISHAFRFVSCPGSLVIHPLKTSPTVHSK